MMLALSPMSPATPAFSFAAALLAGGASQRMGEDKALLLLWDGAPLWRRQVDLLRELGPAEVLVACRAEQSIHGEGFRILPDPPGESGPLPALVRCLEAARLPVLALGVDMPLMSVEVLRAVLDRAVAQRGFVFHSNGFYQPMAALYPPTMLPFLEAARETGRLQQALRAGVAAGVMDADLLPQGFKSAFMNANTPEEWKQAQQSR